MTHQYAVRQSPVLLAFVFLFGGWLVLVGLRMFEQTPFWTGDAALGQGLVAGLFGLAIIGVTLGLLVVFYGELTESTPTPARFPPER